MDLELLLRGGTVVDGTGRAPYRADLGIAGGRILAVADPGALDAAPAAAVLEVPGRAVTPGFIDAHAHSDLAMFLPPEWHHLALAPLRQGVTTEVCGNCGDSPFPTTPRHARVVDQSIRATFHAGSASPTLEGYAAAARDMPMPTNQAPLLGHGSLRLAVMGADSGAPDADALAAMCRLAGEAFEQGAFGLSTGLIYTPGQFAGLDEIAAVAAVAARYDAPYVTHMRDEADRVDAAIEEALEIGRRAGAGVHISHHKTAGRANWGRSSDTLARLDRARSAGTDVTVDVYPYTAGSTLLSALLPPWTAVNGLEGLLRLVTERAVRERAAADFATGLPGWQNLVGLTGWDSVVIASSPSDPQREGHSIAEIAAASGRSPVDAVCEIVVADAGATIIIVHMMAQSDVEAIRGWSAAMVGSDGVPVPGKPHPRLAGTFARALRAPDPADPWTGLADRVHRMTAMPADRYRIPGGRGRLAVGAAADVVVLDPATVADRADYDDPLLAPTGIEHVVVGGVPAILDGSHTGRYGGQMLRAR